MSVLVFDIGGTRIKAGVAAARGLVSSVTTVVTDVSSPDALVAQIEALGAKLLPSERPSAVGVSVKGIVDTGRGAVVEVNAPLDKLSGEPLRDKLSGVLDAPVCIENDARMHALGELRHGAGRGAQNLVCLTVGTGIGVGVILDGQLLRGSRSVLGILAGHITVDINGPPCTCGNIGCLEALIGSQGLVEEARRQIAEHPGSSLAAAEPTPEAIFAAGAAGDAAASATIDKFIHVLSCGVVSLIHVYDPDVVVMGGGVSGSAPQFIDHVQRFADEHAWTQPKGRVRIAGSALGDSAALVGVAELALEASEAA
jgi:glucokinase